MKLKPIIFGGRKYPADRTGKKSCRRMLLKAIRDAKLGQVIQMKPGYYKVSSFLPVKSGIQLQPAFSHD